MIFKGLHLAIINLRKKDEKIITINAIRFKYH